MEDGGGACRIGVLGGGQVFERLHLPALRRSRACRLVAVAEPAAPRREWLGSVLPGVAISPDPQALLARNDLDAVLVLTPPATHADLAIRALRSGRPVLVEKPLAGNAADARAVLAVSGEAGRFVQVGFNRRFRRTFRELRRRARHDGVASFHYLFRADATTWRAGRSSADLEADRAHLLQDVASHQLDLLPWLLGSGIAEVRARPVDSADALELEIGVRFTDGPTADVRAAHGAGYAERLEARLPGGTLVAYPGGVVNAARWPGSSERLVGRAATLADLALARLGARPSLTAQSMDRQLATFVSRVRGGMTDAGPGSAGAAVSTPAGAEAANTEAADGAAGLRAVMATAACEESLRRDGAWVALEI